MKKKFIITLLFYINFICAGELRIVATNAERSLLYLAHKLNSNLIYSSLSSFNAQSFESKSNDLENIISEYADINSELIKLRYLRESRTIIACHKKLENIFDEILNARVVFNQNSKDIFIQLKGEKKQIQIKSFLNLDLEEEDVIKIFFQNLSNEPTMTLLEAILACFKGKVNSCLIDVEPNENYGEFTVEGKRQLLKKALEETRTSEANEFISKTLEILDTKNQKAQSSHIYIYFGGNYFMPEPDQEMLITFLLNAKQVFHLRGQHDSLSYVNFDFYFDNLISFKFEELLNLLIEHDLFNRATPFASKRYIYPIPSFLLKHQKYKEIEILLENLDKIRNESIQKNFLGQLIGIDKTKLSKASKEKLEELTKLFDIKQLYVDTSKWIGDDLPDDYDRWQNFKVSDVELVFERDKTIGKTKYHLKFFKYKEPVKIGGIPLKKIEEADYSTPEKAFFSICSERNIKWAKLSTYDIKNLEAEDSFSTFDTWKLWHSGINPFALILYRVELSQIEGFHRDAPDLYLIILSFSDSNNKEIHFIPMKLVGKDWKSYLIETDLLLDFKKYIEKEILIKDANWIKELNTEQTQNDR